MFIPFLIDSVPSYASLSAKQRAAAVRTLYGALTERNPHDSGIPGLFPIFWEPKQKAYGSAAAFEITNQQLKWFRLIIDVKVDEHARGYCLTQAAKELGFAYFKHSLSEAAPVGGGLQTADGKRYKKPQSAIRSKTDTGANSTRFKGALLQPEVRIFRAATV